MTDDVDRAENPWERKIDVLLLKRMQ